MSDKLPIFNIERFAIHDGEGIRTTVFLQGCQLRCPWCANPESQTVGAKLMFLEKKCVGCGRCSARCPMCAIALKEGRARIDRGMCVSCGTCAGICPNEALMISGSQMSVEEVFSVIVRDADYYRQTDGGVTFSGGEALLHVEALMPLLRLCRENGISVNFETCGHVPAEKLRKALPWTERFLFDLKSADAEKFERFTGGKLQLVLHNLEELAGVNPDKIIIRIPVIPTFNDTEEELKAIFELAVDMRIKRVDLFPYHTLGIIKYSQLGMEYPFSEKKSMQKERLLPYAEIGRKMGIELKIVG